MRSQNLFNCFCSFLFVFFSNLVLSASCGDDLSISCRDQDSTKNANENRTELSFYAGPNYTFRKIHFGYDPTERPDLYELYLELDTTEYPEINYCASSAIKLNVGKNLLLRTGFRFSKISYRSSFQDSIYVGSDHELAVIQPGVYHFNYLLFCVPVDLLVAVRSKNHRNVIFLGPSLAGGFLQHKFLIGNKEWPSLNPAYPKGIEWQVNFSILGGYSYCFSNRIAGFIEIAHTRFFSKTTGRYGFNQTLYSTQIIFGLSLCGIFKTQ